VTQSALFENRLGEKIEQVVAVVDATQLDRQLYLVQQLKAAGFKITIALTMMDLIRGSGRTIDIQQLSKELGVSVVPIDGRLGGGVEELVQRIRAQKSEGDVL